MESRLVAFSTILLDWARHKVYIVKSAKAMGYRISLVFVAVLLLSQVSWVQPVAGLEEWTPTVGASASWQTLGAWSYLQPPPPPARPPICITGDNEFTSANGVVGGDGSENDPFIIENWVIDASSAHGITIRNTRVYFIIWNVLIENGGYNYCGIYLENVWNGKVENVISRNNLSGIRLYSCKNNTLLGNTVENSGYGIYVDCSSNNSLSGNVVNKSGDGIYLYSSENTLITGNTVENNSGYGIYLSDSNGNTLWGNTVENNSTGICLEYSSSNILSSNTLRNNAYNFGVRGCGLSDFLQSIDNTNLINGKPIAYLVGENNLTINQENQVGYLALVNCENVRVENLVLGRNLQGILLAYSTNSWIENVVCENNSTGIYLLNSPHGTLKANVVRNSSECGIRLESSDNGTLLGNALENNFIGIDISYSDNTTLSNNTVENSLYYAIRLHSSSNSILSSNTVINCRFPMRFNPENEAEITIESGIGLYLMHSDNCVLSGNTLENNNYGITLESSENCTLSGNSMDNNVCNFGVVGYQENHFLHRIDRTNLVNGKPVLYIVGENNLVINQENEFGYLGLVRCENVILEDLIVENNLTGLLLFGVKDGRVENILARNNLYGILLGHSENGTISNNTVSNSYFGIMLGGSNGNVISGNTVENGLVFGIYLEGSSSNTLINNVVENSGYLGIIVEHSDNNILVGNLVDHSYYGIGLQDSDNNLLQNNVCRNSRLYDIYVEYSRANLFVANVYENSFGIPHISNVSVSNITYNSATIIWKTEESSTSVVEYGTSMAYGSSASDVSMVTSHSLTLSGLSPSTTYHFRVKSADGDNNTEISPDYTFTTSPAPPPPPFPTSLTVEPSTFSLTSGGSLTLTATLKTSAGVPIAGKTISWSATAGTLSPSSGVTDNEGRVSVTYTTPVVTKTENVTITASFAGDSTYASSKGISTGVITPVPPASTILTITPSSFKLAPGDNLVLEALLTDENRNPLAGRTILWSADKGALSASKTITDNSGRSTVIYTAPFVTVPETVTITASFAGEAPYGPNQASSVGTVSLIGTVISMALPTYIGAGENLKVLVALVDEAGNFLSGKTIKLAASLGTVTPEFSTTDDSGRSTFTYSAPLVTAPTFDFLTASFAGDGRYAGSVVVKEIAILPPAIEETVENVVENVKSAGETFEIPLENELVKAVENATIRGNLGAVVTVTVLVDKPGLSKGFERENIRTRLQRVIVGERVEVTVESDVENGSTVLINLDNRVLPVGWIREVLVDNESATLADDYADILDPNNDNGRPEYLILKGGKGAQILVSIPHFSARVITIRGPLAAPTAWSPLLVAVAIVIIAIVLLLVFRRRR
jgi:parallel beta-helix repeat protein